MASSIRITLNSDVERVLEQLKGFYPTLDYPELFKLGLSELYRKEEFERRERWSGTLPLLELSEAEQASLLEAISEADEAVAKGDAKAVSVPELMATLESDNA
jgi:hypothetical protein